MPWSSGLMFAIAQERVVFILELMVGLVVLWFLLRLLGFLGRCFFYLIWLAALAAAIVWIWAELAR